MFVPDFRNKPIEIVFIDCVSIVISMID